jgi:hypothetical protein
MWGRDAGPGASSCESPRNATLAGASTATAAAAAPLDADVRAPHALRDFVRLAADQRLGAAFNACVGYLWAFRDVHVVFAALYIGKFTAREMATGGTPYRAYLKKHRDESIAHQLAEFGDGALARWPMLDDAALDAELELVLSAGAVSGIPPHLVRRHEDIIRRHGRDSPSLTRKASPSGAAWLGPAARPGGDGGGGGSGSSG